MKLLEILRRKNRTLLEMYIGIVLFGLVCQLAGSLLVKEQINYALSLWCGIAAAMLSAYHMYWVLDRALERETDAAKMIFRGYMIRYALIILVLLLAGFVQVMNPLVVFLGYMSLKVTALVQPMTHKICNRIFQETDPEPQPVSEGKDNLE